MAVTKPTIGSIDEVQDFLNRVNSNVKTDGAVRRKLRDSEGDEEEAASDISDGRLNVDMLQIKLRELEINREIELKRLEREIKMRCLEIEEKEREKEERREVEERERERKEEKENRENQNWTSESLIAEQERDSQVKALADLVDSGQKMGDRYLKNDKVEHSLFRRCPQRTPQSVDVNVGLGDLPHNVLCLSSRIPRSTREVPSNSEADDEEVLYR
ncbi:DDRGK domain-containing protein 1-like [Procambarus clarkii]|uniref:DDRGK domain-containing protein 1-like n=1 Tax=Procambarus clarkii TaxID=6728 RepID=UPI0037420FF7